MNPALQADQNGAGWNLIRERVDEYFHDQEKMEHYFDGLTEQRILFLNAAWTFSEIEPHPDRKERERRLARTQRAHRALWRPVTDRIIGQLAAREGAPVFLLFGGEARDRFHFATRYLQEPPTSVFCAHPTARRAAYFNYENSLRRGNQVLELLDLEPVQWWPPAAPDE